jgi:hypothetical protein
MAWTKTKMAVVAGVGALLAAGTIIVTIKIATANAHAGFLGPANPGAESGHAHWYTGARGAGFLFIDKTDPATGKNDFTVGNGAQGKENRADWRSEIFSLGPAANGDSRITLSFAYKLPGEVTNQRILPLSERQNLLVHLRFFDATGTNFLNERIVFVGAETGDSHMTRYKKMVLPNIRAPKGARTADIRIMANHSAGTWTSGLGRFDDFSVRAVPER